jgi:hypothetical protein
MRNRLSLLQWIWVAALLAGAAAAQSALPDPGVTEREFTRNTHYLTHLANLRRDRAAYVASPEWKESYLQLISWLESFVGNYSEAIADDDLLAPTPPKHPELAKSFGSYHPEEAREVIMELARTHPVIMVNEAHHVPEHRAFTITLLEGLYQRGFRYFAAESLDEHDTALQRRGYATFATGYYDREPVFADMVRTAIRLGYRIVPYEATSPVSPFGFSDPVRAINDREREQAEHLRDRIFKQDPNAKVLVHVGYGHHSEQSTDLEFEGKKGQLKTMGVWFKELTGIDPLTLDSTVMRPHSDPSLENEFYRWATAIHPRRTPAIYRDRDGNSFQTPSMGRVKEHHVVHPPPN